MPMKGLLVAAVVLLLAFPATAEELVVAEPAPAPWSVEFYGRYVRAPDVLVATLFSTRTTMDSYGVGAVARWRWREGATSRSLDEWRFFVDYTRLGFRDGNWLERDLPAASTVHLAWDLGFLSVGASHVWRFQLVSDTLVAEVGLGAAFGAFLGEVQATDVVPTCGESPADCVHWRWASRRKIELPSPVLVVPVAQAGLEWRFWGPHSLRLDAGLYGFPFVGLAFSSRI